MDVDDTPPSLLDPNWRTIPGYDHYICNKDGEVYSLHTKRYLTPSASNRRYSPDSKSYTLYVSKFKRGHISVKNLIRLVWPEWSSPIDLMIGDIEYRQVPEYPNYYIAEDGTLVNHSYGDRVIATTWSGDKEYARISVDQIQFTICINDLIKTIWKE